MHGVLQPEHKLLVRLASFRDEMNLRLLVDSQRLLSAGLVPYVQRIDLDLAGQWGARAETYSRIQRELRNVGGRLGNGTAAAGEAANVVSRLKALGWEARIVLREGIGQTYQWFLEHQADLRTR